MNTKEIMTLTAHFLAAAILSDLSIADIILNPATTNMTIAAKNASTLKNDSIWKNNQFWTLLTRASLHWTLPIFITVHNIHVTQKTRKAP